MNRKTSQGETPVFVNLLSDAGFEAVKALQNKPGREEAKRGATSLEGEDNPKKAFTLGAQSLAE